MKTDQTMRALERHVAALVGRRHCVLVGSGASAIYVALRALSRSAGKVIVPATACPAVPNAVLYAGFEPLFCDVSLESFNLCPAALKRLLGENPEVAAVIPVHLYGQPAPMGEILRISTARSVPVIEDAAQALGGSLAGRPLGTFGDVSILSFGRTKIVDAGGGGAALTDDDRLAERLRTLEAELPREPRQLTALGEEYRRVYYALKQLADSNPRFDELFLPLPARFRQMHLFQLDPARAGLIAAALDGLPANVAARRARALRYRLRLERLDLHLPVSDAGAVPWRFSFLAGEGRIAALTAALRAEGIDASNWYPALPRWYAAGRTQPRDGFPHARRIAREVLNLWVTPEITAARIDRTCALIRRALSSVSAAVPAADALPV
jgi:dTDP-4-amino-4,6-dideoxygalactose transaminase